MMAVPTIVLAYDQNNIKPGWIALVLVLLLALATFLLWRSMNTQLGRIRVPHKADLRPQAQVDDSDPAGTDPRSPADHPESDDFGAHDVGADDIGPDDLRADDNGPDGPEEPTSPR